MLPEQYRLDLLIIRETAARIIADFGLMGIDIVFSGNETDAYGELTAQLIPLLENLIKSDRKKLMVILQKIDISQQKLELTKARFPQAKLSEIMAHLVIEREMQKVIIRKHYGTGGANLSIN
jgi:hypothetical protein